MKIIYFILLIFIANYISFHNGNNFYKYRDQNNKKNKIFDLSYYFFPNLKIEKLYLDIFNWISIGFLIIPFFINFFNSSSYISNFTLCIEIMRLYIPIAIIRAITTNLTILPSHNKCDIDNININELIQGHCYDKLFSGHLALTLVCMYVFYNHNIINKSYAYFNIVLLILYMIISKEHYTNDMIFSFFVVYFVIKENISL